MRTPTLKSVCAVQCGNNAWPSNPYLSGLAFQYPSASPVKDPVMSGAGRPARANVRDDAAFAARRPDSIDRRRIAQSPEHDCSRDVCRPAAVHRASNLQVLVLGESLVGTLTFLSDDRMTGDPPPPSARYRLSERLIDGCHHVIAPAGIVEFTLIAFCSSPSRSW